jgi:hypothetical protein
MAEKQILISSLTGAFRYERTTKNNIAEHPQFLFLAKQAGAGFVGHCLALPVPANAGLSAWMAAFSVTPLWGKDRETGPYLSQCSHLAAQ